MSRNNPACRRGMAVCCAVLVMAGSSLAAPAEERQVWELQPYRVQVWVMHDGSPVWTDTRVEQIRAGLEQATQRSFGRAWQAVVATADEDLRLRITAADDRTNDLSALAGSLLPAAAGKPPQHEKAIIVRLMHRAAGIAVQAREWDAATQTWGPPITRQAAGTSDLDRVSLLAVAAAFAPQARIRGVEGGLVTLRCRSGNSQLRDPRLARFQPGSVLRLARQTAPGAAASPSPDFTYLLVEESSGLDARCRVHSRYQQPLSKLPGGTSGWLALEVGAPDAPTSLRLVGIGDSPAPLAGFEIRVRAPKGTAASSLGRTDRNGTIMLPPGSSPLSIVEVASGPHVLARAPILPGAVRRLELSMPIDEAAVASAGAVASCEALLAETVARREVALLRARERFTSGEPDKARQMLDEARSALAAAGQLLAARTAVERQKWSGLTPAAQRLIDALWDESAAWQRAETGPARIDQAAAELFPPPKPEPEPPPEPAEPPATTPGPGTPAAPGAPAIPGNPAAPNPNPTPPKINS